MNKTQIRPNKAVVFDRVLETIPLSVYMYIRAHCIRHSFRSLKLAV